MALYHRRHQHTLRATTTKRESDREDAYDIESELERESGEDRHPSRARASKLERDRVEKKKEERGQGEREMEKKWGVDKEAGTREGGEEGSGTCVDVYVDTYIDTYVDRHMDTHEDTYMDTHEDTRVELHGDGCIDVCVEGESKVSQLRLKERDLQREAEREETTERNKQSDREMGRGGRRERESARESESEKDSEREEHEQTSAKEPPADPDLQKSPVFPRKSEVFRPKSRIFPQKSDMYLQHEHAPTKPRVHTSPGKERINSLGRLELMMEEQEKGSLLSVFLLRTHALSFARAHTVSLSCTLQKLQILRGEHEKRSVLSD